MSERLVIRGALVFEPGAGLSEGPLDVLVADGVVAAIGGSFDVSGVREIDGRGGIVAPGFVDLHTHLREPGFEQKGTIASETLAALHGGFTTVCAMPNTLPAPDSGPVVEALLKRIASDAHVRVLPIGCVTRGRVGKELADFSEMAAAGCVAFSDDGSPVANGKLMRHALELIGALGLPLSEHADDPVLDAGGSMNEGALSERLGLGGQPAAAEAAAIARDLALCETTGARLHVAHISTARGVELVAEAKSRGLPVTCEVTPSHLFLTEDAVAGDGEMPLYDTNARVNPPLRTEDDRQALLRGLESGVIDAIATDHAPHAIEDKRCEFDDAAPGISVLDTAAGTLLTLVERGELSIETVLRALTSGPVAAFGLGSRIAGIGELRRGVSGDLVLLERGRTWTVDAARMISKGKNTPLLGRELHGGVTAVVMGGSLVFERGQADA